MNMRASNWILLLAAALLTFSGCRKEPEPRFELNPVELYPSNAGKTRIKSNEQYVAILHANLFQTAMSADEIYEVSSCIESIGDKELAREVIISNFMNEPGVILPTVEDMNADVDAFIDETYVRFLVRYPSEAERTYVRNFIEGNPFMTPELVYFSFALSNEFMFY